MSAPAGAGEGIQAPEAEVFVIQVQLQGFCWLPIRFETTEITGVAWVNDQ